MVEDKLIELLSTFEFPVKRQGTLASPNDYPDHFFTFWNNDSSDGSHYDNANISTVWSFDVNFYSVDVNKCYSVLGEAIQLLKNNGFIMSGKGHDMPSGNITHIGRGIEVTFLETN